MNNPPEDGNNNSSAGGNGGGLFIIDDERVPLAAAPNTGDVISQWLAMLGMSGTTLVGTVVAKIKRNKEDEEK